MNKARRKRINSIIEQLENLKAQVDQLLEEEQEAYEALPESLQDGERGQAMQEATENLEGALGAFDEALEALQEATN